jgi:hypothetical protein
MRVSSGEFDDEGDDLLEDDLEEVAAFCFEGLVDFAALSPC